MRIVVDLPAPLGPRKPTTWPLGTSKERPLSASVVPKRLVNPSISIIAVVIVTHLPGPPVSFRRRARR